MLLTGGGIITKYDDGVLSCFEAEDRAIFLSPGVELPERVLFGHREYVP